MELSGDKSCKIDQSHDMISYKFWEIYQKQDIFYFLPANSMLSLLITWNFKMQNYDKSLIYQQF